jgi:hypothetical protein
MYFRDMSENECRDVALLRLYPPLIPLGKISSENECRNVALLRLYKVSRQRIFQFGRCIFGEF